jgi:predicted amidohydrolase
VRVALPALTNHGLVEGSRRDELLALIDTIGREAHPDLVVLPELAIPGYPVDPDPSRDRAMLDALSEPVDGPTAVAFSAAARRNDLLVAVGISERADDSLYDTLAVVGPEGIVGAYRKVHLTPSEKSFWSAGSEAVTVPSPLGALGLAICYDRMFPEGFRLMREQGAEVFLVASAWSTWSADALVDGDVWNEHGALFDRARAAENGVALISANWTGLKSTESTDSFGGGARVVDGLGREVERSERYDWGSVWDIDLAASAARVQHVNGGDFFSRDSARFLTRP